MIEKKQSPTSTVVVSTNKPAVPSGSVSKSLAHYRKRFAPGLAAG
jgi:hypothetical protein